MIYREYAIDCVVPYSEYAIECVVPYSEYAIDCVVPYSEYAIECAVRTGNVLRICDAVQCVPYLFTIA